MKEKRSVVGETKVACWSVCVGHDLIRSSDARLLVFSNGKKNVNDWNARRQGQRTSSPMFLPFFYLTNLESNINIWKFWQIPDASECLDKNFAPNKKITLTIRKCKNPTNIILFHSCLPHILSYCIPSFMCHWRSLIPYFIDFSPSIHPSNKREKRDQRNRPPELSREPCFPLPHVHPNQSLIFHFFLLLNLLFLSETHKSPVCSSDQNPRSFPSIVASQNEFFQMFFLLLLLVFPVALAQQWTPQSYPNPRKGGFKECKMRSVSSVCDPDEVLFHWGKENIVWVQFRFWRKEKDTDWTMN